MICTVPLHQQDLGLHRHSLKQKEIQVVALRIYNFHMSYLTYELQTKPVHFTYNTMVLSVKFSPNEEDPTAAILPNMCVSAHYTPVITLCNKNINYHINA